jgi:uridine phosphorylase
MQVHKQYSLAQAEAHFYGSPKLVGERILFIKRQRRLAEYEAHLSDVYAFGNVWHGVTGGFRGQHVTIVVAGVGPGLVGDAVYALNRPAAMCLYSGTCGGLGEGLDIGDYVVADGAVCGDGYSLHLGHPPLSVVAGDPEALQALEDQLASRVERVDRGLTFTTSSVVREVDPEFWKGVDEQCRGIEMGAAAFYSAARATGKRATAYFWVTDLPLVGKSFFDPSVAPDIQTRQDRYERSVLLDLELLTYL